MHVTILFYTIYCEKKVAYQIIIVIICNYVSKIKHAELDIFYVVFIKTETIYKHIYL